MQNELVKLLKLGRVEVTFTKVNGEKRVMLATLNEALMPVKVASDDEVNRNRAPNDEVQVVYDLEKQAIRSFRKDSVISFSMKG